MRKATRASLATLVLTAGFVLAQQPMPQPAAPMQPMPAPGRPSQLGQGLRGGGTTLRGRVAAASKVAEADVNKVLEALGPAIRDLLGQGQTVEVPNLGTFRVVRVPEHRDLVDGRPATIPGSNSVEFLPTGRFADAANQPGVKPAETVPPFEYNPLPDQTPGLKTGNTRSPNSRIR